MSRPPSSFARAVVVGALFCLAGGGCGTPSKVNIELRKENQRLQETLQEAEHLNGAYQREIAGLRQRQGTLATLPPDRLAQLFTTHGLSFSRLTGGADLNPDQRGDEGLAVHVVPTDQQGQSLKAAGSFDIEAFDLAEPKDPLIGHWHFDLEESKQAWNALALVYCYSLICPWQKVPKHEDITIKVTFLDALTQTPYHAQEVVRVTLPSEAATRSTAVRR
jgi:hypothetical protein